MSLVNFLTLLVLAALWGGSFMFMRIAAPEFGPIPLIAIRVLVASCFLVPIWAMREPRNNKILAQKNWRGLFTVGLLNSAIPFVLFAFSALYISGGFASILNSTVPIWTAIIAWLWLARKPNSPQALGLALGLCGVGILVSSSLSFELSGATLGILATFLAAFTYGIAANYVPEKLSHLSPLTIATFSLVAATVVLVPLAIVVYPSETISVKAWVSVIVMGLFCTGVANILYFKLLSEIGSTKAVTVTFLIPIFGNLWGVLFIDEVVTIEMLVGTTVILFGTALVTGLLKLPIRK